MLKPFNFLLLLIATTSALYSSNTNVLQLTTKNFDQLVLDGNEIWVVEFFASWCSHCVKLAPEYAKAAKALLGVARVGAVNAEENEQLRERFAITGFPTIKIFSKNNQPQQYNGPRTANGIAEAALLAAKHRVNAQLVEPQPQEPNEEIKNLVVELTDENFDEEVLTSPITWMVEFYAPWCGHCQNLARHWIQAASELEGKAKLGAIDATIYKNTANKYNIQGYPVIKMFPPGSKEDNLQLEYDGSPTSSGIVTWALEQLGKQAKAPDIKQIVNNDSFRKTCEPNTLCVLSILPHILDCQADCRKEYITTLSEIGATFRKITIGWTWSEAGSQPLLENALGIGGYGYPALAVLNTKKLKFSLLRGPFSKEGIQGFLRELSYGKGSSTSLQGMVLPKIVEVAGWDGNDAEVPPQVAEDLDEANEL